MTQMFPLTKTTYFAAERTLALIVLLDAPVMHAVYVATLQVDHGDAVGVCVGRGRGLDEAAGARELEAGAQVAAVGGGGVVVEQDVVGEEGGGQVAGGARRSAAGKGSKK